MLLESRGKSSRTIRKLYSVCLDYSSFRILPHIPSARKYEKCDINIIPWSELYDQACSSLDRNSSLDFDNIQSIRHDDPIRNKKKRLYEPRVSSPGGHSDLRAGSQMPWYPLPPMWHTHIPIRTVGSRNFGTILELYEQEWRFCLIRALMFDCIYLAIKHRRIDKNSFYIFNCSTT